MWKFLRSITVILTSAFARACAAFRPPKPAPTITTRGFTSLSIWLVPTLLLLTLPFFSYLYKIQPDGRRFQKFFRNRYSCMGSLGAAVGGGFDLYRTVVRAPVYASFSASVGRCWHRVAYPHGAADSRHTYDSARGFVLFDHDGQAVVCVGVAVRRGGGKTGSMARAEWSGVAYGGRHRGGFCVDVSNTHRLVERTYWPPWFWCCLRCRRR